MLNVTFSVIFKHCDFIYRYGDNVQSMLRPKRMTRFVVLLKISIVLFGFLFLTQQYLKSFAFQQEIWKSTTEKPEPKPSVVLQNVLYFNRIPKTGSENFVFLMSKLSKVRHGV